MPPGGMRGRWRSRAPSRARVLDPEAQERRGSPPRRSAYPSRIVPSTRIGPVMLGRISATMIRGPRLPAQAGRGDVLALPLHDHRRPHRAGDQRGEDDADHEDDVARLAAQRGQDEHGHDDERERQERVDDPAEDVVDPASVVPGDSPSVVPPARPSSVARARPSSTGAAPAITRDEHVPAEVVVPEPVVAARRGQRGARVDRLGSTGTIHRHSSAETTQNSTMPKPIRNVLRVKQRPHELRAPLPSQLPHVDGRRAARQLAGQPCLVDRAHVGQPHPRVEEGRRIRP